jgi:hypothetical protein
MTTAAGRSMEDNSFWRLMPILYCTTVLRFRESLAPFGFSAQLRASAAGRRNRGTAESAELRNRGTAEMLNCGTAELRKIIKIHF